MKQSKINRINELARKSKKHELSESEKKEQIQLRNEYIQAYKNSLISQLENTYIVDEYGNKKKLQKNRKIK